MAEFFNSQLDFIFFLYGLAFVLLGAVCFSIPKRDGQELHWAMLGSFAFVHAAAEWLDLAASSIGDSPAFALARTLIMAGSFVLLIEFARLGAIGLGRKAPGRWIYAPLTLLVVLGGAAGGLVGANASARYAMGLVGTMGASLVFALLAGRASGSKRRWANSAAVVFALYGIAAGVVVPAAPFLPAHVLNADLFLRSSGLPIQLVRALLACWAAISVWQIRSHALESESPNRSYVMHLRKQRISVLVTVAGILVSGWSLTQYLGRVYTENLQIEMTGDLDVMASNFSSEIVAVERLVKSIGGSPSVFAALIGGSTQDYERANTVLDVGTEASGAAIGYVMDRLGLVIASSNRRETDSLVGHNYSFRPYFQKAIAGQAGYFYGLGITTKEVGYYASYPVRNQVGGIVGVAVLKYSLDAFEEKLQQYDHPFFFIDPHGVVILTDRPKMRFGALWPLPAQTQLALSQQYGKLNYAPVMEQEFADEASVVFDGQRNYARRRPLNHGDLSLVIFMSTRPIIAARFFAIIITLLISTLTVIYFVSVERVVADNIKLTVRLELEERARMLGVQATTDPLTGIYNRLKFNQALSAEMTRSTRYKTPLSLLLYDIDHFKNVNDSYGHSVGDKVLVDLCGIVAANIRQSDLLARWGGEEFVVLASNSNEQMASQLAQKLRIAAEGFVFDQVGTVTCSFGVAQFQEGDTAETLIARADQALYQAKAKGRNRVEIV